jgi:hypothetical protein
MKIQVIIESEISEVTDPYVIESDIATFKAMIDAIYDLHNIKEQVEPPKEWYGKSIVDQFLGPAEKDYKKEGE